MIMKHKMEKTILDLRDINKFFGGVKALSGFSMSIRTRGDSLPGWRKWLR